MTRILLLAAAYTVIMAGALAIAVASEVGQSLSVALQLAGAR